MDTVSKILTLGGATQDVYLSYQGADCMKIMERSVERSYMLFESGAKVEVDQVLYYTGGGSTNSAVSFKRLGFEVSTVCMVGDDQAGGVVVADLKEEGVNVDSIAVSKEHSTALSFVINSLRRDRTIFAYRGANSFLTKKEISFELIEKVDQLYITSLSNEAAKILQDVVKYAKKCEVSVAINPGTSQLSTGASELKESLKYIDILILNSSEARTFMRALVAIDEHYQKMFACECASQENLYFSIPNFFKEVMKMGPKIVVVTDGARGVYVATKDEVLFHPSMKVTVVDTLGAGDSFGSCFVAMLCRGLPVEDALRCGIVNSASVIGHLGAKPGLLTYKELEQKVRDVQTDLLQRYEW